MDQLLGWFNYPAVNISFSDPVLELLYDANGNKVVGGSLSGKISSTSGGSSIWYDAIKIALMQDVQLDYFSVLTANMLSRELTINTSGYFLPNSELTFRISLDTLDTVSFTAGHVKGFSCSISNRTDASDEPSVVDLSHLVTITDHIFDDFNRRNHSWLSSYQGSKFSILHSINIEFVRPWYQSNVRCSHPVISNTLSNSASKHRKPCTLKVFVDKAMVTLCLRSRCIDMCEGIQGTISLRDDLSSVKSISLVLVKVEFVGSEATESLVLVRHLYDSQPVDGSTNATHLSQSTSSQPLLPNNIPIDIAVRIHESTSAADSESFAIPSFDTAQSELLVTRLEDQSSAENMSLSVPTQEVSSMVTEDDPEDLMDTLAVRYSLRLMVTNNSGETLLRSMEVIITPGPSSSAGRHFELPI